MDTAAELAGFFAAHAVWSVSEGETLIPLLAKELDDGQRTMDRLIGERIEEGVARGQAWMAANPDRAVRAVLIYDGFITLESKRMDGLIITIRDFTQGNAEITMAVPYRPAGAAGGFAVHRPKFLGFEGPEPDWQKVGEAFWSGIGQHEHGARIWNDHIDESK